MTAYDPANLFAKMIAGSIPAIKVFEDEVMLVIMDIFPQSRGHTLVIPKVGSRNLLDADPAVLAPVFRATQKIARAAMRAFGADGVTAAMTYELSLVHVGAAAPTETPA